MTMEPEKLEKALDTSVEKHAFSGVVCIRWKGNVLYERAAGYADRSNKIENTLDTRFGIASGGKFFTALAIGKLIEAGELSFSTRLKDCVDLDFPRYPEEITIRHLLTHTSGIPDYYDEEQVTDYDNYTVSVPWHELRGPRDYLAVFPDEDMKFAPGARFSYSNGGYILLGVVIEELTGMKYQDVVEQAIFGPIGMARSGFFALNKLPERTALGYVEEEGGWRTNIFNVPIVGASDGGAYTTVRDLATLWDAFWSHEILSQEMVEIYVEPYVRVKEHRYYGHGVWIYDEEGADREDYIIGSDAGVSFYSSTRRGRQMQTTVISNTSDGAWPILNDIEATVEG
jgi:CubicO group peptidase (beta-lactamase class C family)